MTGFAGNNRSMTTELLAKFSLLQGVRLSVRRDLRRWTHACLTTNTLSTKIRASKQLEAKKMQKIIITYVDSIGLNIKFDNNH